MTDSGMICMEHRYGTHELQKIAVWRFPEEARAKFYEASLTNERGEMKYWFVYLHGGAWRDLRVTHLSAEPSINALCHSSIAHADGTPGSSPMRGRIAGVASISYRLSPHPKYRQERAPNRDDGDRVRNARHPDHIDDVRKALKFLDTHYGFDGTFSYVLVGHSVGATMGLQYVMELPREKGRGRRGPFSGPEPHAVIGVEGLYDLPGLVRRYGDGYREFIAGAYGEEEELWRKTSPALFKGNWLEDSRTYNRLCHLVVLGWSPDDELVDGTEIDVMEETLRNWYFGVTRVFRDLEGSHDGIVEDGEAIARVLISTVEELDKIQDHLGRPDLHRAMARRRMANEEAASLTQGRSVINTPQESVLEEARD